MNLNLSFLQFLTDLMNYAGKPSSQPEASAVPVPAPSPVYAAAAPVASAASLPAATTPVVTASPEAQVPRPAGRTFFGGQGRDVLVTGAGDDVMDGGMGNDVLDAGGGHNFVHGGMGNDKLTVGDGNNEVNGGMGHDTLVAGHGRNRIDAGMGNDVVTAGNGGNQVDAGMGNDRVTTGSGNDTLVGGMGNDWLSAGAGDDTYRFEAAFGEDVIANRDAGASVDRVEFSASSGIQAQQLWFRRDGADLVVDAIASKSPSQGGTGGINGLVFSSGNVFGSNTSGQLAGNSVQQREGSLTLRNWYTDPASQVDVFQDASGRTLQRGQVEGLVSAMAGFGGVPANLSSLSGSQRQQLEVVIAQNWAA